MHKTQVLNDEATTVTTTVRNASPKQPEDDVNSADDPPAASDFAAAMQMIASFTLNDAEKAEAIRRLLAERDA